jgi:uncharacterized membrane protein
MHFAYPFPWWAAILLAGAAALAGHAAYGFSRRGRASLLGALRASALLLLLLILFRPVLVAEQRNPRGGIVPILVDESRSMRIADAGNRRRIDVAVDVLRRTLLPRLAGRFQAEVLGFGDVVSAADADHLSSADQPRTDVGAALRSVRDRYRDQPVAGVVVLSDGGNTELAHPTDGDATFSALPVFTVGVGGESPDREVKSVTIGDSNLAGSTIDLDAVVSSRGFGAHPFDVRLLLRDHVIDVRRVTPVDGSSAHVSFSLAPEPSPALYSVDIPADPREAVRENNSASVLVMPPGRKRRILFVEGAPGFEHSFLRRAWAADPAIEVDSVVRKGKNEQGQDAFFVQADPARTPALIGGFPKTRASLFGYDAIVFGNVEWDFLTRDQLAMTADFVRERGGGVIVLGARSFASAGLAGTPLEEALPLELGAARSSVALTANAAQDERSGDNRLRLTGEGREHAIMRVAASAVENEREWAALPSLSAVNLLGPPKPGASVLAVAAVHGSMRPLLAVQRYGRGRTVEFAGEASWRWKMLMPASDRTHEIFWRQVLRWLSAEAPDPVTIVPVDRAQPGVQRAIDVLVADAEFRAAEGALVTVRVAGPDGEVQSIKGSLADRAAGRYSARVNIDRPGVYRVDADARQGTQVLGTAQASFLAGASDPEFADPRLNASVLQRISASTGGRYVNAADAASLPALLASAPSTAFSAQPRDLWQHPLVFALVIGLLGCEWALRRRWGFA